MVHLGAGRKQFARPPFRSYRFWVETLFLLMVILEALFFAAFFRSRLNGQAITYMIFPVVALSLLWFGVLRTHQAAHDAYFNEGNAVGKIAGDDPRIDTLLDNLAYLSYAGFVLASVAVAFVYIALAYSLG